ncbi:hypothetical protein AAFF_G00099780, partial [Aldrovandia affinis]
FGWFHRPGAAVRLSVKSRHRLAETAGPRSHANRPGNAAWLLRPPLAFLFSTNSDMTQRITGPGEHTPTK